MTELTRKTIFKLGRLTFSVTNCDSTFAATLEKLLPAGNPLERQPADVFDIKTGCNSELDALFSYIRGRHRDCVWIDAACLVSPMGAKVLLVGPSNAGKSTTALALALAFNWKVLAEDITLIDYQSDKILSFPTPFSLKPGTAKIVQEATGKSLGDIFNDQWLPLGDMACNEACQARFDLIILLRDNALDRNRIELEEITAATFVRQILDRSNLLRIQGSIEKLSESLSQSKCFTLKGGTLSERIKFIQNEINYHLIS
jgi:hypothetical protein